MMTAPNKNLKKKKTRLIFIKNQSVGPHKTNHFTHNFITDSTWQAGRPACLAVYIWQIASTLADNIYRLPVHHRFVLDQVDGKNVDSDDDDDDEPKQMKLPLVDIGRHHSHFVFDNLGNGVTQSGPFMDKVLLSIDET